MSDYNKIISFTNSCGNKYLVEFKLVSSFDECPLPIVDISLVSTDERNKMNQLKDLFLIISNVSDYLDGKEVILYYYCDTREIARRDKNVSPQEYRSNLFSKLFDYSKRVDLVLRTVKIKDTENNMYHFISLITNFSNLEVIEDLNNKFESAYSK